MAPSVQRRTFLAASTLAIPTIAFARIPSVSMGEPHSDFEDCMDRAGDALKGLRAPLRSLDDPAQRQKAALLANSIAMCMTQGIAAAEDAQVPDQAKGEYGEDTDRFHKDLCIELTEAVSASIALARALWQNDETAIKAQYDALRSARKDGHDAFKQDDDD